MKTRLLAREPISLSELHVFKISIYLKIQSQTTMSVLRVFIVNKITIILIQ